LSSLDDYVSTHFLTPFSLSHRNRPSDIELKEVAKQLDPRASIGVGYFPEPRQARPSEAFAPDIGDDLLAGLDKAEERIIQQRLARPSAAQISASDEQALLADPEAFLGGSDLEAITEVSSSSVDGTCAFTHSLDWCPNCSCFDPSQPRAALDIGISDCPCYPLGSQGQPRPRASSRACG
jgi:hypothetical protein